MLRNALRPVFSLCAAFKGTLIIKRRANSLFPQEPYGKLGALAQKRGFACARIILMYPKFYILHSTFYIQKEILRRVAPQDDREGNSAWRASAGIFGKYMPLPCHPERSGERKVSRAVERVLRVSASVNKLFLPCSERLTIQGKIPPLGRLYRAPKKYRRTFWEEERQAQRAKRQTKCAVCHGALARRGRDDGGRLF